MISKLPIPFQFHAGNAKLPAGNYRCTRDKRISVLWKSAAEPELLRSLQLRETELTTPNKNELIFNKIGDRYFLPACLRQAPA